MSRAGLATLLFCLGLFLCVSFAAPLSERPFNLVERSGSYENELLARSLAILIDREFDTVDPDVLTKRDSLSLVEDREFDDLYEEYVKRGYDISAFYERSFDSESYVKREFAVLQRRNIFQKIGDAFKHAFSKVKEGFQKFGGMVKKGFQTAGAKIKQGFQTVGAKIKQGFQTAGAKIKQGFQTAGAKIKQGFQTAGKALKKGFQKVGNFIKTTGAKIAKFGLKVYSAVATVASKVAKFIPVIGQPLSMAMKGAAMGANIASNKIHADLGKLDKVSKGLDYVISPFGTAAKKLGGAAIATDILTRELDFW